MATRPGECGYCNQDHGSDEPCPELDRRRSGPTAEEELINAATLLTVDLRRRHTDPMKPWFAVGTRYLPDAQSEIVLYCTDANNPPVTLKEWHGYPVVVRETAIPTIGG